jgi:hypothetical protein
MTMHQVRGGVFIVEDGIDDTLLQLLGTRSLGEVYRDSSLDPGTHREFTRIKGRLLFQHLLTKARRADLFQLHRQLEQRFPARPVDLDTLARAIREVTGEDPRPFIKEWHDEVEKLPAFVIRDARVETFLVDEEQWQRARFKIHNRGVAGGTISVELNSKVQNSEHFVVAPGAYKEVYASTPGKITSLKVGFGLSMNLPTNASFSFNETGAVSDDLSATGERDIDPAAFPWSPPAGTIIVDNNDEGFRVVESLPWLPRLLSRGEGAFSRSSLPAALLRDNLDKEFRVSEIFPWLPRFLSRGASRYLSGLASRYPRWRTCLDRAAYGDEFKSLHQRQPGTGKSRVEWTTTIEEEGVYDLHAFASYADLTLRKATFYYSVSTPGEETLEVPVKLFEPAERWVHLGRFRVKPGACTVSLSDRIIVPEEYSFFSDGVQADAIRWTRINTP